MNRPTLDVVAAELLMRPDANGQRVRNLLAALARAANKVARPSCPACGSVRVDDNGATRPSELSFCCADCGEHFDAEPV